MCRVPKRASIESQVLSPSNQPFGVVYMNKTTKFNLTYALIAVMGVILLHDLWAGYRSVAPLPYNEFKTLVREGKVESQFFATLLSWFVPVLLFVGIWLFIIRRASGKTGGGGGLEHRLPE